MIPTDGVPRALQVGLLIVWAGGHHCLWCPKSGWSLLLMRHIKNWQKQIRGKKVMAPWCRGEGSFLQKNLKQTAHSYFQTPQKIFKYYSVAYRITRWIFELKMAISEQFKLLDLKKMRAGGGQNEDKWKKRRFAIWQSIFSLLLFFDCSLGFPFIDDLYRLRRRSYNILNHSKWRRIEKDLAKCPVIGITYIKGHRDEMKLSLNPSRRPSVHPSGRPCESPPWKLPGCRLHTIPLLSLTLQLSAHQGMKWSFPWIRPVVYPSRRPSVHPFGRPCESTPWKLRGCRLHTIPLLSLTLQLSAHQEWEGNKPRMALHPCHYLDTSSSMCCLLACWTVHKLHILRDVGMLLSEFVHSPRRPSSRMDSSSIPSSSRTVFFLGGFVLWQQQCFFGWVCFCGSSSGSADTTQRAFFWKRK